MRAFIQRSKVEMRVCGTCGLRDPEVSYERSTPLRDLPPNHWVRPDDQALARLDATPAFELIKRNASGVLECVEVRRRDLHNFAEVDGQRFHVVPEAVLEGGHIDLCPCCWRKWRDASAVAQRRDYNTEREEFGDFAEGDGDEAGGTPGGAEGATYPTYPLTPQLKHTVALYWWYV